MFVEQVLVMACNGGWEQKTDVGISVGVGRNSGA